MGKRMGYYNDILIFSPYITDGKGGHWLNIVFWSPSKDGRTAQNMSILANTLRIRYKLRVHTFHDYKKAYDRREWIEKKEKAYILWDCRNHMDTTVEKLFQTAELVIINFPQDEAVIASYLKKHYKINGRVFYLINGNPASFTDGEKLCKNVFRLKEEESGMIPYNLRFEQYYEKKKGFFYQKRLLSGSNYGIEEKFEKKTREIAVKVLKMNCLLQEDTLYYSISKGE